MRVVMYDALASQYLDKRFRSEVPGGHLPGVAVGLLDLAHVLLRSDVLLPHQRCRLGACAGKRRFTLRIGAVGHLQPAVDAAVIAPVGDRLDVVTLAQLDVDGLAADQVAGPRHQVGGRDPARECALEAGVAHVDRVEHPCLRLDRVGRIAARNLADVAVRIHQAGDDDAPRNVDRLHVGRQADGGARPDHGDLAVVDDQNPVFDRFAGDRHDRRANERFGRSGDREGQQRQEEGQARGGARNGGSECSHARFGGSGEGATLTDRLAALQCDRPDRPRHGRRFRTQSLRNRSTGDARVNEEASGDNRSAIADSRVDITRHANAANETGAAFWVYTGCSNSRSKKRQRLRGK